MLRYRMLPYRVLSSQDASLGDVSLALLLPKVHEERVTGRLRRSLLGSLGLLCYNDGRGR